MWACDSGFITIFDTVRNCKSNISLKACSYLMGVAMVPKEKIIFGCWLLVFNRDTKIVSCWLLVASYFHFGRNNRFLLLIF